MDISVSQQQGNVSVTVIKPIGQLDGQSYQDLISRAQDLYQSGARDFILDLSDLTYISSAGIVALHSIALLAKGEELPDPEHGWATHRSLGHTTADGLQGHVKLFNPREEVRNVLHMVGFTDLFEIFTDFDAAVRSF